MDNDKGSHPQEKKLILGFGPIRGGVFRPIPTSFTDLWAEIGRPVFSVKLGPHKLRAVGGLAGWD